MPLTINKLPKQEDKVITMGKDKADYYPPGATEPQVRPAHVPQPAAPVADVEESIEESGTTVVKTVKKASKSAPVSKKK